MSGSSWFDLSSIQDQISKGIQEAAKIAEDASKYDILNFDAMAVRDAEEEEGDYDSGEEESKAPVQQMHQGFSGSKPDYQVRSTAHEDHDSTHNGLKVTSSDAHVESSHTHVDKSRLKGALNNDSDNEQHEALSSPPTYTSKKILYKPPPNPSLSPRNEGSIERADVGSHVGLLESQMGSPSLADYLNADAEDCSQRDKALRKSLFPPITAATSASSSSFPYSAPSSSSGDNRERESQRERDADCNSSSAAEMPAMATEGHGDSNMTPVKTVSTDEGGGGEGGDDFFGAQFKEILTVKKDKPARFYPADDYTSSGDTDTDHAKYVGEREKERERDRERQKDRDDEREREKQRDVPPVVGREKRKKKKKGGGLNFFGISEAPAPAPPVAGEAPSGPSHPSGHPQGDRGDVNAFSFFEPVGMLSDEVEEAKDDTGGGGGWGGEGYSSSSRMPQRLPGLVIGGSSSGGSSGVMDGSMMSLTGAGSAAKALFSFFDNVEDEIDSSEDPILRQVAFNKANPHVPSQSQYSKAMSIFGLLNATGGGGGGGGQRGGDVDIESDRGGGGGGGHMPSGTVASGSSGPGSLEGNRLAAVASALRYALEGLVVFCKGLSGCLLSVFSEQEGSASLGPSGYAAHVSALLRREGGPQSVTGQVGLSSLLSRRAAAANPMHCYYLYTILSLVIASSALATLLRASSCSLSLLNPPLQRLSSAHTPPLAILFFTIAPFLSICATL